MKIISNSAKLKPFFRYQALFDGKLIYTTQCIKPGWPKHVNWSAEIELCFDNRNQSTNASNTSDNKGTIGWSIVTRNKKTIFAKQDWQKGARSIAN